MLTAARWRLKPDLLCDLRWVEALLSGERLKCCPRVVSVPLDVVYRLRHARAALLHEHLHPGLRVFQRPKFSDGLSDPREACRLWVARCSAEHLQDCRLCRH